MTLILWDEFRKINKTVAHITIINFLNDLIEDYAALSKYQIAEDMSENEDKRKNENEVVQVDTEIIIKKIN